MKKQCKELALNQGPIVYYNDAPEGMAMGDSQYLFQYLLKSCNFYNT